nr:hypothetical protein [Tanacetum cinerariifolium]
NKRTRTCYECGSLRHYKSECPVVKFHKRVDVIHGKALEQVRRLHTMNVGIKGTTREIARSERTKTMKTKIKSAEACGVVHAFGGGETGQDLNNTEDEIEA